MTRIRTGWALVAAAILLLVPAGPVLAPHPPTAVIGAPFLPPGAGHPLGTDVIGRDVLSRVLHGGLPLVSIAVLALALSYAAGVALGVVAGLRRRADPWISRPVDAVVVLPWFLLLAVIATALGAGPVAVATATALAAAPWIVRIVRTATLEIAATGYVESARARGEPLWRLGLVEVLPNLRPVLAADAGVRLSATMSIVAVSSFLGLGLRPPSADWALMITENRQGFAQQPVAVLAPALLIMALVVAANMVSDRALDRGVTGPPLAPVSGGDGVRVRELRVRAEDGTMVLDGIDLDLPRGSAVAVVGASGAGKTTLALAILGALPAGLAATGQVSVGAECSRAVATGGSRAVGYVPQDPGSGLNPALRIGTALAEITRLHGDSVGAALRRVGLPDDRGFRRRYPHQLSGGQQQRVLLAMALLGDPALVVLDEPTTGLDAVARAELVHALRRDTAVTLLVVTHDPAALAPIVQHVAELDSGRLVSFRPIAELEQAPATARKPLSHSDSEAILRVDGLTTGHHRARPVVTDLSFTLHPGRCLALTGPSGAGKTTLARTLAGLHPLERGTLTLRGRPLHPRVDHRPVAQRRAIQLIFQNPATSLNPAHTIGAQIARPLRGMTAAAAARETRRLLAAVRLDPDLAARRPDRLSGGQQQRAALARALAAGPEVLLCDEITASLDHRAAELVLDVLDELRGAGVALIVISHQRWVIERLADQIIDLAADYATGA